MKIATKHRLQNCDPEDISDALVAVQRNFGIEYASDAFKGVKTFGELCDVVVASVRREHRAGCTAQQAFYKLRRSITSVLRGGATSETVGLTAPIRPTTRLDELFPGRGRKGKIQEVQWLLGTRLELLEMTSRVGWGLLGGYLLGFLTIFINWRIGVAVLVGVAVINWFASQFGNKFVCATVGDASRLFVRDHYRRARRDPETVNNEEIVPVIKAIFVQQLALEPEVLTRDEELKWQ